MPTTETRPESGTRRPLADTIARAIVRQYRLHPGPTWREGEGGEVPRQITLYVKELDGVRCGWMMPTHITSLESSVGAAQWPMSRVEYLHDLSLVYMERRWPEIASYGESYTGKVVVRAIDNLR